MSTTPWLNTIEFLCSHRLQTMAAHTPFQIRFCAHTPFQIRFCLWLPWNRWNLSKWVIISLCWTDTIPIHLKHNVHTLQACLHSRKRCWCDSSLVSHNAQTAVFSGTPLLLNDNLVGTLLLSTLHAVIITLGNVFTFHSCLKKFDSKYWCLVVVSNSKFDSRETLMKFPNHTKLVVWQKLKDWKDQKARFTWKIDFGMIWTKIKLSNWYIYQSLFFKINDVGEKN